MNTSVAALKNENQVVANQNHGTSSTSVVNPPQSSAVQQSAASSSSATFQSINVPTTAIPIYIGNLSNDIHESNLHSFFSNIGIQPVSARICRNNETKKSLNYGYINFQSQEDADNAMAKLNYMPLMGRPVRMMACQRDPTNRRSGKGNIIVKNMPNSVTHRSVYDTLDQIGKIISISLKPDPLDPNHQNAFVQYEDEETAKRAVAALNSSSVRGSQMLVAAFKPQKEEFEKQNMHDDTFVNCYVKNIPKNTIKSDEELKQLFLKFGPITSCKLAIDHNGVPTGVGFVCFENHQSAKSAVEEGSKIMLEQKDREDNSTESTESTVNSKPLVVCRFMRKNERNQVLKDKFDSLKIGSSDKSELLSSKNNNVYVKNLHPTVTDEILSEEFAKYGKIVSAKVMLQDDKISRGFGFVSFETPKEAENAIAHMHGTYFFSKPLHCELAQKKAERLENLRNQFKSFPYSYAAAAAASPANMQYFMKSPASYFTAPNYMSFTPPTPHQYQPMYSPYHPGNQQQRPAAMHHLNAEPGAGYLSSGNTQGSRMYQNSSQSTGRIGNANSHQNYDSSAANNLSGQDSEAAANSTTMNPSSSYTHNIRYNKGVRNHIGKVQQQQQQHHHHHHSQNNQNSNSLSAAAQMPQTIGGSHGSNQHHSLKASSSSTTTNNSSSSNAQRKPQHDSHPLSQDELNNLAKLCIERLNRSSRPELIKHSSTITGAIVQMQSELIKDIFNYRDEDFYNTAEKILQHVQKL